MLRYKIYLIITITFMSLDTNLLKVDAAHQYQSNNIAQSNLANQPLQTILASFQNYQPRSNVIDFKKLTSSPYLKLKKYKDAAYYGEVVNGKRSGLGVIVHNSNRRYEGEWQCDFKNGKGYQQLQNGCVYQGYYVNGKPQGLGKYQWPNGEYYEGEWLNGLKHGFGTWNGVKGDKYVGQWKFGKADGQGVHVWINGDKYQGQFKQCLKHGKGTEKFTNGDLYTGQFYKGKSHGYGEYYWANGSYYKGNFLKGKRNGHGIWKRSIGNSDKYEGEYVQDRKEGYGIFTWYAGNIYKGNYRNDQREGYGQMYWTDGSYYKGQWHKGVQQGEGTIYTVQQGEKKGVFHNNLMTELMIEEQDEFSVPVKVKRKVQRPKENTTNNRMTQIQQRNRYYINSNVKKYTSLQLKGPSKNKLKEFVKDKIMNRTYSKGSNRRTVISSKKQDQFPKSVLKKQKVKNINPLPERKKYTIPYESIYTHKLDNSLEDDTSKLLQTNTHKTKPFRIDFSDRLNNSTVL